MKNNVISLFIDSVTWEAFVRYFDISAEQRDKMGVRSREIAESLFDKNKFIESYIKLIEA